MLIDGYLFFDDIEISSITTSDYDHNQIAAITMTTITPFIL